MLTILPVNGIPAGFFLSRTTTTSTLPDFATTSASYAGASNIGITKV